MSRPSTLPSPWIEFASAVENVWLRENSGLRSPGKVFLAAKELLCFPVTLRRWANGSQIPSVWAASWIRSRFAVYGIELPASLKPHQDTANSL